MDGFSVYEGVVLSVLTLLEEAAKERPVVQVPPLTCRELTGLSLGQWIGRPLAAGGAVRATRRGRRRPSLGGRHGAAALRHPGAGTDGALGRGRHRLVTASEEGDEGEDDECQ